jgi:hypothetical protein
VAGRRAILITDFTSHQPGQMEVCTVGGTVCDSLIRLQIHQQAEAAVALVEIHSMVVDPFADEILR